MNTFYISILKLTNWIKQEMPQNVDLIHGFEYIFCQVMKTSYEINEKPRKIWKKYV